jgi:hypothetical protein
MVYFHTNMKLMYVFYLFDRAIEAKLGGLRNCVYFLLLIAIFPAF